MLTLPIPVPTLTDIGKKSNGATFSEAVNSVWEKMQGSFTSIGSGLGSAASALGDGATNALKGAANLLGSGKDGAAGGAKAVSDGAKDALKKVGNLFGK